MKKRWGGGVETMKNEQEKKKIKERRAAGRCALSSWHPPARPGPAGLSRQKPARRERERSETQTHPCPGCGPPGFPPPPSTGAQFGDEGPRQVSDPSHGVGDVALLPSGFGNPQGWSQGTKGRWGTGGARRHWGGTAPSLCDPLGSFFFLLMKS